MINNALGKCFKRKYIINIKENFIRTIEFNNPQWIPCTLVLFPLVKNKYRDDLNRILSKYKIIFKRDAGVNNCIVFKGVSPISKKGYFIDSWGCLWFNIYDGIEGQVIKHPLENWGSFNTYKAPDPMTARKNEFGFEMLDWSMIKLDVKKMRKENKFIWGCGERLFDRLYFLRGFSNLMIDFATDNPNLPKLIEMIYEYEYKLIKKWLSVGVDAIWFHTDIGTQNSLMISPKHFRMYLKPMFKNLFSICRNSGVHVFLSTDGRIVEIIDDFIQCGVSIQDPQLGPISIEEIEKYYKGKVCIYLNIDEQKLPFCSPQSIKLSIKNLINSLNLKKGGLILSAPIHDDNIPLSNIEAICEAFIKYYF